LAPDRVRSFDDLDPVGAQGGDDRLVVPRAALHGEPARDERRERAPAAVHGLQPQARRAQLDALLVFFTTLSLYCLLRQLLLGGGWRWAIGAGIAAGLGTLSKVVGFFSFMVLLPWLYAVWSKWPGVRWQRPWPAWLLAGIAWAAVVAAWLLPVWLLAQRDPGVRDYFHELVFVQTFGRYVDPWHHYRPAWYYLQVMATLWLPAVLLLPWLLPVLVPMILAPVLISWTSQPSRASALFATSEERALPPILAAHEQTLDRWNRAGEARRDTATQLRTGAHA